jgi:HD-GYP domain-containing protein (c-di-GMP phosphodiesterase class II)
MRCVNVSNLKPGDVLGRSIYDNNGRALLVEKTVLTQNYIQRLREHWVVSVYIDDPKCSLGGEDIISQHTRHGAIKTLREIATDISQTSLTSKQDYGQRVSLLVEDIIEELLSRKNSLINVIDLKDYDNYTYAHSVNVTVLSVVTGISLGLEYSRLKSLGMGALLHDVGKIFVPLEVLNKPGKLTTEEFTQIKMHPEQGYAKVKEEDILDAPGRAIILQHHEKLDGSGYPGNRKGKDIHDLAKIVAVADVYDALTSDRPYRVRWAPAQGLEYIYTIAGSHLDIDIVAKFVRNIAPFPLGSLVECSNGMTGYVIENEINPHRPILQVGDKNVDLKTELNITITNIVS